MEAYWQAPAIARSAVTAMLLMSAAVHFGMLSGTYIIFHQYFLWKFPPQIWRLFTAFLLTGPQLGLLFDAYFSYQYLSQLERGRYSKKEDLLWYLTFICGTILGVNYITGLGYMTFLHALMISMTYTVVQDQRGMKTNFYFITIPAQLTPYAMIAINMLFPGGAAQIPLQLEGLFAAHLWEFLTKIWPAFGGQGGTLLPTPPFFTTIVNTISGLAGRAAPVVAGPRGAAGGGVARGASAGSGPLPDSWRTRGPGQRLG